MIVTVCMSASECAAYESDKNLNTNLRLFINTVDTIHYESEMMDSFVGVLNSLETPPLPLVQIFLT